MKLEHFSPAVEWWNDRQELVEDGFYKAKKFTVRQLAEDLGYNLDQCGYPHEEEEILAPLDLIQRYEEERASLNAEIDRVDHRPAGGGSAMTPQELRNSILQLAIQGKLVKQHPEEGTAEELYQQIQKEKQRLIKEGKVKKEKPLPEIAEDEVPFDIPNSWKWVYLCDVATINGGFAFKSTNYSAAGVRVVRISDFNEKGFVDTKIVRHTFDESLTPFLLEEKIFCFV